MTELTATCRKCKTEFTYKPKSSVQRRRFCSAECRLAWAKGNWSGSGWRKGVY